MFIHTLQLVCNTLCPPLFAFEPNTLQMHLQISAVTIIPRKITWETAVDLNSNRQRLNPLDEDFSASGEIFADAHHNRLKHTSQDASDKKQKE